MVRVTMAAAGASFSAVIGNFSASTDESTARLIVPAACTARNLRANFTGTVASRTITLRVNEGATSLSCSVTSGSPTCTNSGSTVNLSTGDFINYEVTGGNQAGLSGYVSAVCE